MGGEGPGGQAGRSCVRAAWPPWSDRQDGAVGAPGRGLKSVKAPRAPSDVSPPAPASDGRREAEGECLPGSSGEGEPQVLCLDLVSAAPAEHGPGVSLRSVRGSEPWTCPSRCRPACVFSAKPLPLQSPREPALHGLQPGGAACAVLPALVLLGRGPPGEWRLPARPWPPPGAGAPQPPGSSVRCPGQMQVLGSVQ